MQADLVYDMVRSEGVIAISRAAPIDLIVDIAEALYAGGIKLLEITCNTDRFAEMIECLVTATAGRMVIGAGTVVTDQLCQRALDAGAEYIVAPDVNPQVISRCVSDNIAVFPGAATATEILTAARLGARIVKVFPAAAIGIDYIRQLRGPIDDVDFIAVGGVRLQNIGDFIEAGCVGIGIGGSVIRDEIVSNRNWDALAAEARLYVDAIKDSRGSSHA